MIYIVPNYFLDENPNTIVSSGSLFTLAYSSRKNSEKMSIRNTMHSMILVLNGTKRVNSTLTNFEVSAKDIFFLKQGNYLMSEIVVLQFSGCNASFEEIETAYNLPSFKKGFSFEEKY